jgi:molecular chaperone GrpE (heat shock protein)
MVFKNFMGTISALYIKNQPSKKRDEKEKYKRLILRNTIKLESDKNIKEIKNKTRDLKSSLEITEKQNENLKKELENKIENVEDNTIYNFLKEINSFKYSEIINHIYSADAKLAELKSKNERLPLDFRFMEIPIKFLKRYFDDIGIREYGSFQKVQKVDETVIEIYDYVGTPFEEGEIKEVELIKKGWKFKDKIISKPTVKELVQGEELL